MTVTTDHDQNTGTTPGYMKTMHIAASPHALYQVVSTAQGIRGWWSDHTTAQGDEITVRFGGGNFQTLRLRDLAPDAHVTWEWTAQYFPVEGTTETDEWVGTRVSFDLQAHENGTSTLVFTHIGLTPHLACYALCDRGWNRALESLKQYLEHEEGAPYTGSV